MSAIVVVLLLVSIVVLYLLMARAIKGYKQRQEIEDMIEIKRNYDRIDAIKKGKKIKRS